MTAEGRLTGGERLATVTYLRSHPAFAPSGASGASRASGAPSRRANGSAPEPQSPAAPEFVAAAEGVAEPDAEAERSSIREDATRALARRGLSTAELRSALLRAGHPGAAVAEELTRLESIRLLDDAELATDLVERLRARKGLGREALRAELARRRLAPEAIAAALADAGDDDPELAREAARARATRLRGLDPDTAMRRLMGHLQRKGFSSALAARAAREALGPASRSSGPVFE